MTISDYISLLNELKTAALNRWGDLTSLEADLVNSSYEWLIDNLDIKRGQIQTNDDLTAQMDDFLTAVMDIIKGNATFTGKLSSFLSDLASIKANAAKFQATTNSFDINIAGVNEAQKAVVNEIMNQYTGNGLNAGFATPLRDGVFRNILVGMNMREAKGVLNNYILSGKDTTGKLGQYLQQTAMQSVDAYTGMLNQKVASEFKFTGYIISGSLIETSSKQCVYAVELSNHGYLSFAEWRTVLEIARNNSKARLIEGTTLETLPFNKLHWGCRHDFTPTVKKAK